jgi:dolichyl-phosphate-mannose--protein O-mannosyl transferase
MCWTIFIAPIGYALAPLIVSACKGEYAFLKIRFNRLMFYNYWIGFISETYLFLAVCAGLNILNLQWSSYGEAINSLLALFFGMIVVVFPFFTALFYSSKRNYERIIGRDVEFLSRFDGAIGGLNFKRRNRLVLIYLSASNLRKLWLAHVVIY